MKPDGYYSCNLYIGKGKFDIKLLLTKVNMN